MLIVIKVDDCINKSINMYIAIVVLVPVEYVIEFVRRETITCKAFRFYSIRILG